MTALYLDERMFPLGIEETVSTISYNSLDPH